MKEREGRREERRGEGEELGGKEGKEDVRKKRSCKEEDIEGLGRKEGVKDGRDEGRGKRRQGGGNRKEGSRG